MTTGLYDLPFDLVQVEILSRLDLMGVIALACVDRSYGSQVGRCLSVIVAIWSERTTHHSLQRTIADVTIKGQYLLVNLIYDHSKDRLDSRTIDQIA